MIEAYIGLKAKEVERFRKELEDRFGALPGQVSDLMEIVRTRRKCLVLGVERLLVKNGKMTMYFIADQASMFYQSAVFSNLLKFVQSQTVPCRLSEKNDKLSLVFEAVKTVGQMAGIVSRMYQDLCGRLQTISSNRPQKYTGSIHRHRDHPRIL